MEQIQLPTDGRSWWKKLLNIDIQPTAGEVNYHKASAPDHENFLASQEWKDAGRLVESGTRLGDEGIVAIGRARLRSALGKGDST